MQIRCKGDLCFMFLLCIIFTKYRFFVAFPPLILYNKIRISYNRIQRSISYERNKRFLPTAQQSGKELDSLRCSQFRFYYDRHCNNPDLFPQSGRGRRHERHLRHLPLGQRNQHFYPDPRPAFPRSRCNSRLRKYEEENFHDLFRHRHRRRIPFHIRTRVAVLFDFLYHIQNRLCRLQHFL